MAQLLERLKMDGIIDGYKTISGGIKKHRVDLSEDTNMRDLTESLSGSWKIETRGDEVYVFDEDQPSTGALRS